MNTTAHCTNAKGFPTFVTSTVTKHKVRSEVEMSRRGHHRNTLIYCETICRQGLILLVYLVFSLGLAQEFQCFERDDQEIRSMIVGAEQQYFHKDYPWMVNLAKSPEAAPHCGGVLINNSTVLTAAHCLHHDDIIVRQVAENGTAFGELRSVNKVAIHEDYEPQNSYWNDVALLRLESPFPISTADIPRLLSPTTAPYWAQADDCARVLGWGLQQQRGASSNYLLGADLLIWSQEACHKSYPNHFNPNNLCAGYPQGGIGTCQGDSGGPLFVRGGPSQHILVGIVSFGRGCAQEDSPTVYSRISDHYQWIFEAAETLD